MLDHYFKLKIKPFTFVKVLDDSEESHPFTYHYATLAELQVGDFVADYGIITEVNTNPITRYGRSLTWYPYTKIGYGRLTCFLDSKPTLDEKFIVVDDQNVIDFLRDEMLKDIEDNIAKSKLDYDYLCQW